MGPRTISKFFTLRGGSAWNAKAAPLRRLPRGRLSSPTLEVPVVKGCCEVRRVSAVLGPAADTLGAVDGAGTWVREDTTDRHSRTGSRGGEVAGGGSGLHCSDGGWRQWALQSGVCRSPSEWTHTLRIRGLLSQGQTHNEHRIVWACDCVSECGRGSSYWPELAPSEF